MKTLLCLLTLLSSAGTFSAEVSISGNVEAQVRQTWNNDEAQNLPFPLTQDWDQDQFTILYGNLNPKVEFTNSQLEGNLFVRRSYSDLYRNNYLATRLFTFPNKLIARDIFKLHFRDERVDSETDAVINKLYYEHSFEQVRVTAGRMYINYGTGEIFNPINPFNQPTGLTSINNVAQGNDGMLFKFFKSEKHTIDFLFLGDKSINDEDGKIDRTLWIHGEYLASNDLTLDYVGGQDQKRNKIGGQIGYKLSDAMIFFQSLYQSGYVEEDFGDSHTLLDVMLGYDQQLTGQWHLRLEGGYQQRNRVFLFNPQSVGDRFLPVEYFIALANQYEIHPLVQVSGTVVTDFTTGFTYLLTRSTVSLGNNIEGELFFFSPVAKGKADNSRENQANSLAQKLVTQDLGLALRAFF